jgi:hypothetical protein
MSHKIDFKKEVEELVERQHGPQAKESRCQTCNHPKNCKIPMYLGRGHDKIIGWTTCPEYQHKKEAE